MAYHYGPYGISLGTIWHIVRGIDDVYQFAFIWNIGLWMFYFALQEENAKFERFNQVKNILSISAFQSFATCISRFTQFAVGPYD